MSIRTSWRILSISHRFLLSFHPTMVSQRKPRPIKVLEDWANLLANMDAEAQQQTKLPCTNYHFSRSSCLDTNGNPLN